MYAESKSIEEPQIPQELDIFKHTSVIFFNYQSLSPDIDVHHTSDYPLFLADNSFLVQTIILTFLSTTSDFFILHSYFLFIFHSTITVVI